MIEIQASQKGGGGPGKFMSRLLDHMQKHEMVRVVQKGGHIHFTTVFGEPVKDTKFVFRAAAAYYDSKNQKRRHGMNKKIRRAVAKADYVVFQSNFAKKMVQKILKIKAKRSSIICNGFDVSTYDKVEPYELSEPTFVACSDWSVPAKRGSLIIKGFMKAAITDSKLIMIGPGIKARSKNIIIKGRLDMVEISKYLKDKPIFVHMSYAEACPNVVVEALSFGCPVVCNNIGANPELTKEDGVIVNCDKPFIFKRVPVSLKASPKAVAKGLRKVLETKWNVKRDDLSMEECAKKYLKVFEEVLKSTTARLKT